MGAQEELSSPNDRLPFDPLPQALAAGSPKTNVLSWPGGLHKSRSGEGRYGNMLRIVPEIYKDDSLSVYRPMDTRSVVQFRTRYHDEVIAMVSNLQGFLQFIKYILNILSKINSYWNLVTFLFFCFSQFYNDNILKTKWSTDIFYIFFVSKINHCNRPWKKKWLPSPKT